MRKAALSAILGLAALCLAAIGGQAPAEAAGCTVPGNGLAAVQCESLGIPFRTPNLTGAYCMAVKSGTMAAGLAANAPIASFRYGGTGVATVRRVEISLGDTATAFAAGVVDFDLVAARAFTASDSGGNAATLTGNNGKLATGFATTAIADLRVSSTAALSAGTRTLDATPLSSVTSSETATAGQGVPLPPLHLSGPNEYPLVLANNEGFAVLGTVPGTGTWSFVVKVCWDELTAYP